MALPLLTSQRNGAPQSVHEWHTYTVVMLRFMVCALCIHMLNIFCGVMQSLCVHLCCAHSMNEEAKLHGWFRAHLRASKEI